MMPGRMGVGIDFGSHAVKVAWVRRRGKALELVRCLWLERSRLEEVTGKSASEVPEGLRLAAALKAHLLGLKLKIGNAAVALSGREMIFRLAILPARNLEYLRLVAAREAEQIAGGTSACHDFRLVSLPTASLDQFSVLLAVAKEPTVQQRLDFFSAAGVRATAIRPSAAALFYAYRLTAPPADETTVLVDVGQSVTEVVIIRHGQLIFARGVSPAGREFTDAVRRTLAVSAANAERIKRQEGAIASHGGDAMSGALASVAQQLSAAVQSTLQLCRTQAGQSSLTVRRVLLSGGGARLRGLANYLSEQLHLPVVPLDVFSGVRLPIEQPAVMALAAAPSPLSIAVGLAASQLEHEAQMDLMPEGLRKSLEFRRKGVFSVAGAALLVVAAAAFTLGAHHSRRVHREELHQYDVLRQEARRQHAELQRLEKSNRRLVRQVELLSCVNRPARALVDCLQAIRDAVPDAVRITELLQRTGDYPPPSASGVPLPEITLTVSGTIRQAATAFSDVLNEFVENLQRDARIDSVDAFGEEREESSASAAGSGGKVMVFTLKIRPRPPEEALLAGASEGTRE